jgi:ribonuclease P protein subunit POP4
MDSRAVKKAKLEIDLYNRSFGNANANVIADIAGVNAITEIPTTKTLMLDVLTEKEKLKQSGALKEKEKKERPRRHPAKLGRKKLKELSRMDVEEFTFDDMRVLNRMWCEYMEALIGKPNASEEFVCSTVLRAEFVGSIMTVVESRSPEWIGKSGIVYIETMHSFKWITKDNRKMTVLKEGNVFSIEACGFNIRLFGKQLVCRPGERSSKNLKSLPTIEL